MKECTCTWWMVQDGMMVLSFAVVRWGMGELGGGRIGLDWIEQRL